MFWYSNQNFEQNGALRINLSLQYRTEYVRGNLVSRFILYLYGRSLCTVISEWNRMSY